MFPGLPASITNIKSRKDFVNFLGIQDKELSRALMETKDLLHVYRIDRELIKGKYRNILKISHRSSLYRIQRLLQRKYVPSFPLCDGIIGYRKGVDYVDVLFRVCYSRMFIGKLDITDFHPSISTSKVVNSLMHFGIVPQVSRIVASIVTYRNEIPQGICTSNNIANITIEPFMRERIVPYCDEVRVRVFNYGDDFLVIGTNRRNVEGASKFIRAVIEQNGFKVNERKFHGCVPPNKTQEFLGLILNSGVPNLCEKWFKNFRAELHGAGIHGPRAICPEEKSISEYMSSLRGKLRWAKRINERKYQSLVRIFDKIRWQA